MVALRLTRLLPPLQALLGFNQDDLRQGAAARTGPVASAARRQHPGAPGRAAPRPRSARRDARPGDVPEAGHNRRHRGVLRRGGARRAAAVRPRAGGAVGERRRARAGEPRALRDLAPRHQPAVEAAPRGVHQPPLLGARAGRDARRAGGGSEAAGRLPGPPRRRRRDRGRRPRRVLVRAQRRVRRALLRGRGGRPELGPRAGAGDAGEGRRRGGDQAQPLGPLPRARQARPAGPPPPQRRVRGEVLRLLRSHHRPPDQSARRQWRRKD